MDIYNPYVASDMKNGIFDTLEPYLDEVNNYIHSTAAANGIPVAERSPGVQWRGWHDRSRDSGSDRAGWLPS